VYLLINSRVTDMELYSSKYELISHSLYFWMVLRLYIYSNLYNVAGRCHFKISHHSTYFTHSVTKAVVL
jgi:hypothetical protein